MKQEFDLSVAILPRFFVSGAKHSRVDLASDELPSEASIQSIQFITQRSAKGGKPFFLQVLVANREQAQSLQQLNNPQLNIEIIAADTLSEFRLKAADRASAQYLLFLMSGDRLLADLPQIMSMLKQRDSDAEVIVASSIYKGEFDCHSIPTCNLSEKASRAFKRLMQTDTTAVRDGQYLVKPTAMAGDFLSAINLDQSANLLCALINNSAAFESIENVLVLVSSSQGAGSVNATEEVLSQLFSGLKMNKGRFRRRAIASACIRELADENSGLSKGKQARYWFRAMLLVPSWRYFSVGISLLRNKRKASQSGIHYG